MSQFLDRFTASSTGSSPLSLQMLYFEPLRIETEAVRAFISTHLQRSDAECEWIPTSALDQNILQSLFTGSPPTFLGLFSWENHEVKVAQFDEPMPYGPVESCVGPALIPPPMKVDSKMHKCHMLLYYSGTHPDVLQQYCALCAVAGVLAQFDAIVVLHEEARTAIPAFDLIPEPGENAMETYQNLPIPYLFGGFCKMTAGDDQRPWVRTFANHRLGLPNLARQLDSHEQTRETFQLFSGIAGYLRQTGERFEAGDTIDTGVGNTLKLRSPTEAEWFLESEGTLLVIE